MTTALVPFTREAQLRCCADSAVLWDVVVIGGGATGLGVALDAVSRGYKALVVEGHDFAKGTSGRSTKLVHGGVRYLAQGNVKLVREASVERGLLVRNAPHLVRNQTFIIPVYNFFDRLKYTAGLKVYDWVSGSLTLGSSVFISREETIEALPGIKTEGLSGGVRYHDGQFDDSRLAINLAQTIAEKGGCAVNYARVTGLRKHPGGTLTGVTVKDLESGTAFNVAARAVVNATGVFVDDVLRMDNAAAGNTIRVSQGVHLVLDKSFYPSSHALMIPETSDGRVLFAVPWHNKVVVGTTDTPVDEATVEPQALEKEIHFILTTAGEYFTKKPTRADVRSVFAGLRPLAAPQQGLKTTKEISRSHKIVVSPSRLFTVLGGKWTTFRKMGEDTVNMIEGYLRWPRTDSTSAFLRIHGWSEGINPNDPFNFYGSDGALLLERINGNTDEWLSESLKIHPAQVVWAVENEMARTVEDVLARRTRALFLDAKESIRIAPEVARITAEALGYDETWAHHQITQYTALANQYLLEES